MALDQPVLYPKLLDFSLTPEQQRLVELSDRLAREQVAPRAARYDREAELPAEDYEDLRANGLTAMNVPRSYGGLGLDQEPLTYALVLKNIAHANGSTALTLNMHSSICYFLTQLASPQQQRFYFGEVVEQGKLFASTSSEPGTSFRGTVLMDATAEPVDGGYRVNALKHFASLSTHADYYWTWATPPGQPFGKAVLFMGIPSDSAGVEILRTWDSMSMRATASHSLKFSDVFVPERHVVGQPGDILSSGVLDRFMLGYCATYLGVAEAAYDYSHDYAATRTFAPNPNPICHLPQVQARTAEMSVMLETANLLLRRAAQAYRYGTFEERTLRLNHAKYYIGAVAPAVADSALKLVGGRGVLRRYELERFVRDTRTAPIMPPSGDRCLDTIGKLLYNLDASTFDA
jgi:alkylation response protein AidB-like acyl-CoA dehydrogenase